MEAPNQTLAGFDQSTEADKFGQYAGASADKRDATLFDTPVTGQQPGRYQKNLGDLQKELSDELDDVVDLDGAQDDKAGWGYSPEQSTIVNGNADLSGLKLRVPGGYINELMSGLGATTQFMSAGEVYEKLSRGVIDGVTFTMEALTAFKLTKDIRYTMTVPGGLYNTTWFVVMNQAKWEGLSEADRKAIEGVSGEAFAKLVGAAWNKADEVAIGKIEKDGVKIYPASDAFLAEVAKLSGKLEADWVAAMSERGLDGAAALAAFREQTGAKVPE